MRKQKVKLRRWLAMAVMGGMLAVYLRRLLRPRLQPPFLENSGTLVMAHRGGQGLWPANTLYAFKRAADLGVDVLELDIQLTADGEIVVRHDPTVDRTTNGSGAIRDLCLKEIKLLDAGYTWTNDGDETHPFRGLGITIPTLEELFEALPEQRLNIDIKPANREIIPRFCNLLRKYHMQERVMVGSFHHQQLQRFRKACPNVATSASPWETRLFYGLSKLGCSSLFPSPAAAFQIPEYHGDLHVVTPRFLNSAHHASLHTHVWTVNESREMQRLIDWGVDGIITDFPNRLLAILGKN